MCSCPSGSVEFCVPAGQGVGAVGTDISSWSGIAAVDFIKQHNCVEETHGSVLH